MRRDASVQVWMTDGARPPEGVPSDLPPELVERKGTPPGWFNEAPRYAAELYALERWTPGEHAGEHSVRVSVSDVNGDVTRWVVRLVPTVEAVVRPDPERG